LERTTDELVQGAERRHQARYNRNGVALGAVWPNIQADGYYWRSVMRDCEYLLMRQAEGNSCRQPNVGGMHWSLPGVHHLARLMKRATDLGQTRGAKRA